MTTELEHRLRTLVDDWRANGNVSVEENVARTWHRCAVQLLTVLEAESEEDVPSLSSTMQGPDPTE